MNALSIAIEYLTSYSNLKLPLISYGKKYGCELYCTYVAYFFLIDLSMTLWKDCHPHSKPNVFRLYLSHSWTSKDMGSCAVYITNLRPHFPQICFTYFVCVLRSASIGGSAISNSSGLWPYHPNPWISKKCGRASYTSNSRQYFHRRIILGTSTSNNALNSHLRQKVHSWKMS